MRTWSAARTSLRGRTVEWASVFTLRSAGRSSRRLPREPRWRRNNCGVAVLLDDLEPSVTEASANSKTCDRCHRSSGVVHLPEQYVAILFSKVRLCLCICTPGCRAAIRHPNRKQYVYGHSFADARTRVPRKHHPVHAGGL